jgi:predicted nucleic-acid-binding protein
MRLALDTGALIKYLTWDQKTENNAAVIIIESADTIIIPTIVLCETVGILKDLYGVLEQNIIGILQDLTTMPSVEIDRQLVEAGLSLLKSGGDFTLGVILAEADRAKADHFGSFDQKIAHLSKSFYLISEKDV